MGNIISSFLGYNKCNEDLSLENACNILKNPEFVKCIPEKPVEKNVCDNVIVSKVGNITQMTIKKIVIDNLYIYDKNDNPFELGQQVAYDLISSNGKERVLNVNIVNSEWDLSETTNNFWNNRIIICKVEERINRILRLSPGDIELDMNKVSLDFLPIIGDWLEVDVKCTVNENMINLSGKILEINQVFPLRPHIESGKITHWNSNEWTGTINKHIFFNKQSIDLGYIPVMGDKVVAEVIESEQNRCSWRALKIVPEYMKVKTDNSSLTSFKIPNYQDTFPGLEITGLDLTFDKLNTTKTFKISISNMSEKILILKNIEFLNNNSQCRILEKIDKDLKINQDGCKLLCECTARNMGESKEFLLLTFDTFNIGKWLNINVSLNFKNSNNFYEHKTRYRAQKQDGNETIRVNKSNRFKSVNLPNYTLPQKLLDTVSNYESRELAMLIEELKILKPVLFNNLTYINYEDKFHTLIYLDEITNLIAIKNYDQEKACFIRNGEYLMLEIENLSERRPSIIVGDKIIASDPTNESKTDFEGIVEKVGAKHVFLKFPSLLHDQYSGEDYTVMVVPGRSSYRRLHHAIYLSVRNLGPELLFPTKLLYSEPQVQFKCDTVDLANNKIDPLSEMVQLDWHNKRLNLPQQNAVINILKGTARPLPYIIFGPPGTGKTVTIIETILQIIRLIPHARLLVTAPSNSAADLIALRLIDSGILKPGDLVRLVSYSYALSDNVPPKLIPYCAAGTSAKEGTTHQEVLVSENGILLECSQTMIGRHRLTVSTCCAAGQLFTMGFAKGHFSHIIVDEAAQAGEPDVMIPLSFLDKTSGQIILAGDPQQLGPVIMCKVASQCGLNESYLERMINRFPYVRDFEGFPDSCGYDPKLVTKLTYNYRSLPDILGLYSSLFYCNELIPTIDDKNSTEAKLVDKLCDMLPKTNSNKPTRLLFHGVEGENYQTPDSPSWFNPHEAAQVFFYVNELYRLGLSSKNIGIITPYIKQAKEIRSLLVEAEFDIPKIGTVEEFQGQEFDVIILSTVRSHKDYVSYDISHSLGFIACPKRLNVAISRSKALLIVIGNPNLLCSDSYWRSVVNYCLEKGIYTGCML